MQSAPEYWFCTRCKIAYFQVPECGHVRKHHRATCDTDYWLWWRYRLAAKPAAVRQAIAYASQGLRYSDWSRVVSALRAQAEEDGHLFSVAERPEKSSLADS